MQSKLNEVAWPVRTPRLSIRRAELADLDAIWRIRRLEEVNRWLPSDAQNRGTFIASLAEPEKLAKTLVPERDGVIIGDLMLAIEDGWAQAEVKAQAAGVQAELGYAIDPAYAGQGLATEAVEALLELCFDTLGLRRVVANLFADNVASRRLLERVGMRQELYSVKESLHRSGEWLDGMGYALLADEWRARRTRVAAERAMNAT